MNNVRDFAAKHINLKRQIPADLDLSRVNLIKSGLLDSIEFFGFVLALENHYNIRIGDDEIASGVLETIDGIESLIRNKH
ncbi:MAG: hypothetical protein LBT81_04590 [Helicobacteraceae bacterium]|nr:hypothetical protein [Helicobacteraceae bacterium]